MVRRLVRRGLLRRESGRRSARTRSRNFTGQAGRGLDEPVALGFRQSSSRRIAGLPQRGPRLPMCAGRRARRQRGAMKQARLLLVGMLMVLLRADRPAAVVAFLGPAEVSLRILTSAPGGFSEPKCSKSVAIALADRFEWRIAIDEATPAGNREKTVLSVRCGTEPGSSNGSPSDRASIPTLSASISTLALLENQAEDEKVLRVEVKINSQELTGFEDGGKPSHHSVNSRRELFFAGSGVAYLPLWLPDERIREPLGLNEVLLEISAKMPAQAAPPGYGTLRLLSVPGSSAVLLDGGAVKLLPGKEPKIENVRPGLRLVSVRDASGRDVRRIVRVEADRTSLVDFGPAAGGPGRLGPIGRNPQGF